MGVNVNLNQYRVHFVGVGGVGMSALAQLYDNLGAQVSGSDQKESALISDLKKKGITISIGHSAEIINSDLDVVVYSSAIPAHNPEIVQARKLRLPIIPRAEALAEIMRFKRGIAVGGTHGKTSTTSMISSIFMHSQFDPTIAVGGRLKLIESTARLGQGPWMVAEADESDGSFLRYQPEICIITNIDNDHLDHYGSFENLQKAFLSFALNIPFYGSAVVYGDDPKIRELFKDFTKKIDFYGQNPENDFILKKQADHYSITSNQGLSATFQLQVPGVHNALNGLAAAIATWRAGVPWEQCMQGLNQYSGVDRRFQKMGHYKQIPIYDDYAHHPTEINATLNAAREICPKGKIHLVYQPHRFSRTRDCWQDYQKCFSGADHLYLLDIYPAGEKPLEGVTSAHLAQAIGERAEYHPKPMDLVAQIKQSLNPNDIVLTMGAGDVWQLAQQITEEA
jgi:UDP-N-acetylmuramate--alanine ligase